MIMLKNRPLINDLKEIEQYLTSFDIQMVLKRSWCIDTFVLFKSRIKERVLH
jgi:hypothetical protein